MSAADLGIKVEEARLGRYAENAARTLPLKGSARGARLAGRLGRQLRTIRSAALRLSARSAGQPHVPKAVEWLLDNRYLMERAAREAIPALRSAGRFPADRRTGLPAAYTLAAGLARAGQNAVTGARVGRYLAGAQAVRPLSEKELWLFVPLLKAALIESVAELCGEMLRAPNADPTRAAAADARLRVWVGQAVTSLRTLTDDDLSECLQKASTVEKLLRQDPAEIYGVMDEASRAEYRRALACLARRARLSERQAAEAVLKLARRAPDSRRRHVGYYILERPLGRRRRRPAGALYFGAFFVLTAALTALVGVLSGALWPAALLLLPVSDLVKSVTDFVALRVTPPRRVPRLELPRGLPAHGSALCVVSVLLTDSGRARQLCKILESYKLANRDAGERLLFGLLADLPDAPEKRRPGDETVLRAAQEAIFALNRRYGGGFYLFLRDRQFHVRDGVYMGWERKRGALLELMRLLRGRPTGLRAATGDVRPLRKIRYVITLDADTRLTAGAAREMVGAMLHPLAAPQIDPARRVVTEGHAVLQPRLAVDLETAGRTLFARIFVGQGGIDPYGGVSSDVYQDLFGRGLFMGKGIFDTDAYLTCLDGRFPENLILSHDLLEGCYLRAGMLGDVELTDGCPTRAGAWFDRLHRWTRGDWQIVGWLGRRVRDGAGGRSRNPLDMLSKWKILDNLRRSLSPACLLLALTLGLAAPARPLWTVGGLAVLCAASHLLLSVAERVVRGGGRVRYHSDIITGVAAAALQCGLTLLLLPHTASVCLRAAVTALYRVCVSRRRLLRWRTAAESERAAAGGFLREGRKMGFTVAWGAMCATFSAAGWAAGLLWTLSPAVVALMGRPRRCPRRLPGADRAFLMRQAALIWQYFEDFLTPEDHHLPPDNWQEQPAAGLAHRTSPTNVGLGLLCVLAALDLGFVGADRALRLIDRMLTTLEDLPKWHGHLYNWIDTRTLAVLRPRYVSTVDSGNLACCLIALREGLDELRDAAAGDLAARADKLARAMRFQPLYDARRRLFAIGADAETGRLSESHYDLLASEARQTSYLAVARGEVERRHWRRLGRALVMDDRYRGMASWTGTMFEYLMPHLLMPCFENSLLFESARFCVYCHRKRGRGRGVPWGISESCFYAFDSALQYRYKAHGVPRLAFKRGLGREYVVSSYASYLALLIQPQAAVRNLRALRALGMEGRYGLFEAADFTPARRTGRGAFEVVRCFMSHHLGMSLLAVDNALRDGVMQRRFMRDPEMGAFAELLQEKVPVGAVSVRPFGREVPEKPVRAAPDGWRRAGPIGETAVCHVLANDSYTLLCTESGATSSRGAGRQLTRFDPRGRDAGASGLVLRLDDGRCALGLPAGPGEAPESGYVFDATRARWWVRADGWDVRWEARVPGNEVGEWRAAAIKNTAREEKTCTLACYWEPVLAERADYEAHPAFSKLFLETYIDARTVTVRRRPRVAGREAWLAFACDHPAVAYDTSRERALGRGGAAALAAAVRRPSGHSRGAVLDPCVLARVPLSLGPGETAVVRFALTVADTERDAAAAASRLAGLSAPAEKPGGLPDMLRRLGLTGAEALEAFDMLSGLLFGPGADPDAARQNRLDRSALWKFGLSGDLPLILCPDPEAMPAERLGRLIRQHRMLSLCGAACDLAILTGDGADYRGPTRGLVMETLKHIGAEGALGARGGVHLIDRGVCAPEETRLLRAAARRICGEPAAVPPSPAPPEAAAPTKTAAPTRRRLPDGAFQFDTVRGLPPCAWSHVLANPSFGALVTDAGTGYLWRRNARENQLTPWVNDPLAVRGGERIAVRLGEKAVSLFADGDGCPVTVTYGFGYARWEKTVGTARVTTEMFVPPHRMARVLTVRVEGAAGAGLRYESALRMGPDDAAQDQILPEWADGMVTARSYYRAAYNPQTYAVLASSPLEAVDCRAGAFSCEIPWPSGAQVLVLVCGCAGNEPGLRLLRALADEAGAARAREETAAWWRARVCPVRAETPDAALNHYLNGWALYQVQAVRLHARTSLYQCGGAFGFRDQLQDACALVYGDPAAARRQILRACAHQFEEGDVQHWWHPAARQPGLGEKGVRTRCSDDLLWLPYAVCEYVEKTGDGALLAQPVPYLSSPPLAEGEHERYETPAVSSLRESVYAHCLRAADRVLARGTGAHGLLLMGGGDWNDGFNRVGAAGRGESVWLTWFASHTFARFPALCERGDDAGSGARLRRASTVLAAAAEAAWDGAWYRRGYYDDGATLGAAGDGACRIDSVAQSFAMLAAGPADAEALRRRRAALQSAWTQLVDREKGVVRLLTPPFGPGGADPGYIKGYVPGVRENGGQYTHAAVWLAMGFLLDGQTERGWEILRLLLPETRDPAVYRVEPHVLAADVYDNEAHAGRGGWNAYTGAAAWYYRVAVEHLLGVRWRGGAPVAVRPRRPAGWHEGAVWAAGKRWSLGGEADTEVRAENPEEDPPGKSISFPGQV
ncbi:MAG: hypothetical protein LBH86_05290 [Oscillospiraceae bacterium]|jgi:cyclic beta-1,2-glucan synthetase|nr:hypothetical protein [Oscillospiraceae bacterium]